MQNGQVTSKMGEPKQIEEALKKCEEKFLRAFRESPLALTLTTAKDYRYLEVNETFERITGWNRDEIIGRTPFDIELWVDPSERIDLVRRLLSGGTVRDLEFRARMKNRKVRIALGSASLIEISGETCVFSLSTDVTDLKRAEEAKQAEAALSRMGRRLIQAHEKERTSIAQELHEYVERLTMMSIDLDHFRQNPPSPMGDINQQVGKAIQQVEDLVLDIQSLSHRLHSSELEYLGLETAARNFCKEFSDHRNIDIEFASEGTREELPPEISLCVFRVLQEAVQNAASHSGSPGLKVSLEGGSNELHLTVHDSGTGFDSGDALKGPGLGLIIMRERLKLVDGELSIESQRGHGTTIHARVPLSTPK